MIRVTTMAGKEVIINAELIERVESVPETVITLASQRKILVREPVEEVVRLVIKYRRQILCFDAAGDGVK